MDKTMYGSLSNCPECRNIKCTCPRQIGGTPMDIEKENLTKKRMAEMLGEASALFMRQECKGTEIVFPSEDLNAIIEDYYPKLLASHDQALVERVKGTQKKYEYQDKLTKEERYRGGEQCRSCSRRRDVLDVATVLELIKNNKTDI